MDKIACGPDAIDLVDIEAPARENVERVAKAKGRKPSEITVVVLERDRHEELIAELRDVGAKVLLIPDGDVAPAIAAAQPTTGVRTGALLRGVRYTSEGAVTDSIVMRSRSGTVRRIEATHAFDKLERFSGREYRP